MVELLGAQDFSKRVDFEAVETTLKADAMVFATSVLEVFLNADTSDHAENLLPCPCGCMARYRGVRSRKFRGQQLCVSSAAVEAGCKHGIGARLKRSGMRWSKAGANKIAALRACVISNRFDDFWYDRAGNS